MGFLTPESPVVVVGDLRVDRDPDIREILHQAVGLGFADHKAALLDRGNAGRGLRERLNALFQKFDIPFSVLAGLFEQRLVVPVEPEKLFGKVIYGEVLYFELDALFAIQVGQEDR